MKLDKSIATRVDAATYAYFDALAAADKRKIGEYARLVLEAVAAKKLTWQDIENRPGKS